MKYKIKVQELNKYNNKLKYGDFDWKIKYQVVGDKKFKPPQNELLEEIHYDTLLKVLRQTDWAKTPLYAMFLEHGRWVHENENIFSEPETSYLFKTVSIKLQEDQLEEYMQNEGPKIVKENWDKTLETLKHLMN